VILAVRCHLVAVDIRWHAVGSIASFDVMAVVVYSSFSSKIFASRTFKQGK
jgi:hypothetical protein